MISPDPVVFIMPDALEVYDAGTVRIALRRVFDDELAKYRAESEDEE